MPRLGSGKDFEGCGDLIRRWGATARGNIFKGFIAEAPRAPLY